MPNEGTNGHTLHTQLICALCPAVGPDAWLYRCPKCGGVFCLDCLLKTNQICPACKHNYLNAASTAAIKAREAHRSGRDPKA